MNIIFVIQDVKTKEYFSRRRLDEGFNANIKDATEYDSEETALKEIQEEYLSGVFSYRVLEVKKYLFLNKKS